MSAEYGVDKDNTMTILMEDLNNVTEKRNYAMGNKIEHGHTSVKSYLGPVSILRTVSIRR